MHDALEELHRHRHCHGLRRLQMAKIIKIFARYLFSNLKSSLALRFRRFGGCSPSFPFLHRRSFSELFCLWIGVVGFGCRLWTSAFFLANDPEILLYCWLIHLLWLESSLTFSKSSSFKKNLLQDFGRLKFIKCHATESERIVSTVQFGLNFVSIDYWTYSVGHFRDILTLWNQYNRLITNPIF